MNLRLLILKMRCWCAALAGGLLWLVATAAPAQVYSIAAGDIIAANYRAGNSTVVRVNPQTGVIRRIGTFNFPTDVAVTTNGFLYVSEFEGLIQCVNLTNGIKTVVNPNTTLSQVWGITLGPDGDLFVTTSLGDRIVRINPVTGAETNVAQGGQMSVPTGIDFLDPDHVVVSSRANNRVVSVSLLDQTQTVLAQGINGIDQPWGISVFNENIYVGAHDSNLLYRISGTLITNILPAWSPKLAGGPYGIGTDAAGNIVVGVSGGLNGPYALEQRDPQGNPLPSFFGNLIGEITGVEVSRITVLAASQTNSVPQLPAVGDLTTDEEVAIAFMADGTDGDWPLQELTYQLVGDVPAGAGLSSQGVFTWKPTEAQGPSTNDFTMVVTDDGAPSLSATQTFTIVVSEVNTPPVVTTVSNRLISVGSLLDFKVDATDDDLPSQTLTFSLEAGAPADASITTNGNFTWMPDTPGEYILGVVVADNAVPTLADTNHFTVTVREPNVAPVFDTITNRSVNESTLLSFQIGATDTNLPKQTLSFDFITNGVSGATLSTSGRFTWLPSETQGPGTNDFLIRVTDNGLPPLSATNRLTVVVREVNRAPVLDPITDQAVKAGETLAFKVTANDLDRPAQTLVFSLGPNAPSGAELSPAGDFSWPVNAAQPASTVVVTAVVTDDGNPPMTNALNFTVLVQGGFAVKAGDIIVANYEANAVVKIDGQTGVPQRMGTFLSPPTDVALGTNGMLYVAEQGGGIEQLNLHTGEISLVNTNSPLFDLRSIVVGPSNVLYVTTGWDDGIVRVDLSSGIETTVTAGGLISGPFGLALLDSQHLIVSSHYLNRIVGVALTNNTQYLIAEGNGISQPCGIEASAGVITLVSQGSQTVQKLTGSAVADIVVLAGSPCGIGFDTNGNIAISVNGVEPLVALFSPVGAPLAEHQVGLSGYCMGVEVAKVPLGLAVPALQLQWSEALTGPFVDEPNSTMDAPNKTITAFQRGSTCFYRLRSTTATRITGLQVSGGQVVLTYE